MNGAGLQYQIQPIEKGGAVIRKCSTLIFIQPLSSDIYWFVDVPAYHPVIAVKRT